MIGQGKGQKMQSEKEDQDEIIVVLKREEQVKEAIRKHNMEKLAQDEISNFEYEILKIYGVME